MADVTQELQAKITYDDQGAQDGFENLGSSLQRVGDIVSGIIISDILVNLFNQIVNIGQASIQSSAALQNIGVAADYAFGSNSAASQMLTTLNDISSATPFTNTQLDQLAVRMQNMGVPTQQISGDLKDLADIASATGTNVADMSSTLQESGNVLALAYQRGSIGSLQLRGIANQGIPIYDALVKVINQEGVATAESTKAKAENAKKLSAAQDQQITLTQQLADAQRNLALQQSASPNSAVTIDKYNLSVQKAEETVNKLTQTLAINQRSVGTYAYQQLAQQLSDAQQNLENLQQSAPNTALSMDRYNFSLDKTKQTITDLNAKLSDNKDLITQLSQAPGDLTKADLLSNSKNITISAQQLQEAFASIGEGKDLGAAKAQVETFNGIMKDLNQQFQETVDQILGVSQAGVVTKGGLFDQLSEAAKYFLTLLTQNKNGIVAFGQEVITIFEKGIAPGIQSAFSFLEIHQADIINFFKEITKDIAQFAGWISGQALQGIVSFINYIIAHKTEILNFLTSMVTELKNIIDFLNGVVNGFKTLNAIYNPSNISKNAASIIPHFAEGVENFSGGLALVGEKGAELVNLPHGSSVTPNDKLGTTGQTTIHIHNPSIRSQDDISALISQIKRALGRQTELARLGAI